MTAGDLQDLAVLEKSLHTFEIVVFVGEGTGAGDDAVKVAPGRAGQK